MTIFWNGDAAARAGLTSEDMLRLSAASEQSAQPPSQPTPVTGRSAPQIVHTRLIIRDIVQRYPALFGQQPDR